jgi:hypothetical protein
LSEITKNDAIEYLDALREFSINRDIPTAIRGEANYLAALGLSTYTEILGGLYCGELRGGEQAEISARKRYIYFIKDFFPPEYTKVEAELKKDNKGGLYSVIRSGLTHEYFIKEISRIDMDKPIDVNCGITYNSTVKPQIIFYVKQYFEDFKTAFEAYYNRLQTDPNVLTKFSDALESVNSSIIGRIKGSSTSPRRIHEDLSGKGLSLP